MEQMGWAKNAAALMAEMVDAQNAGHVRALEPRSTSNTTPTTFEQFVAECLSQLIRHIPKPADGVSAGFRNSKPRSGTYPPLACQPREESR
jgi:hypothetical protein